MKTIQYLIISFFIIGSFQLNAQENTPVFPDDSTIVFTRTMGFSISAQQIRTGVGWQGSPTIELGLQRSGYAVSCVGIGGINYYASTGLSYDFNAASELENHWMLNPKIGADLMFMAFSFGGELNYYTNFQDNTFGISPVFSLWLGNQWKIQYIPESRIFGDLPASFPNINRFGVRVIYGINLKVRDTRPKGMKR